MCSSDLLKALELELSYLKDGYNKIREVYDYVPMNFEPSMWAPAVKVLYVVKFSMPIVILCLNFVSCLKVFMSL